MTSPLLLLAEKVEGLDADDPVISLEAHQAIGWRQKRVTGLGLNGRTPGRWLWFYPNAPHHYTGRSQLPSLAGPLVRKRVAAALRARAAMEAGE